MKAVFADTFYWIALTVPRDRAYERAQQVTDDIVTTGEVLTEYLTFFAEAPEYMRREVAAHVAAMLSDTGVVRFIPQSHASFAGGFELYRARPEKADRGGAVNQAGRFRPGERSGGGRQRLRRLANTG